MAFALNDSMVGLTVSLDWGNASRLKLLSSISRTTAAKALTFTAERAVPAWRAANRRVFHMRREWINKGVRMRPASAGNLNAQVGTIDQYMQRHVVGLGETKVTGARALFVPIYNTMADQGTHTQTRRSLARMQDTHRKPFILHTESGKVLLVRRTGKGRTPLQVLGVLQESVHIEPKLDALETVARVVNREFGPVYERLLLKMLERGEGT
jgi:hypothetical protein